ncbi:hypothetical protein OIU84_003812 [Salix udensis]|uniref:Uncharacterized protein n=1 Tax=Salix udensis TaxID=889485 RepID=A0AAD6K0Q4_9ROSI|nr:hypothetical protein OIU84_003812 [Salix udensis]
MILLVVLFRHENKNRKRWTENLSDCNSYYICHHLDGVPQLFEGFIAFTAQILFKGLLRLVSVRYNYE